MSKLSLPGQALVQSLLIISSWAFLVPIGTTFGTTSAHASPQILSVPNQVIVRFKQGTNLQKVRTQLAPTFNVARALVPSLNLFLVRVSPHIKVTDALDLLKTNDQVLYAQLDHRLQLRQSEVIPDDIRFDEQWSLHNPSSQVDIGATQAWSLGTGGKDLKGNDIVVAVVDAGMDLRHRDLKSNIWVNEGEIPWNEIDDDGNGYVDDVNGWNAYGNNGDVNNSSHGTHVAGIIGAAGNNGKDVAGINWDVKLMAVAGSSGSTSVISTAYGYVLAQKKLWLDTGGKKGANIVVTNSSFGVDLADCESGQYPVWNDLYNAMGEVGILSAAATANRSVDVDSSGDVPTGCASPYLVTVTNTTIQDQKYAQAAWGKRTIDLGAPGTNILSTIPGATVGLKTGTSMATPHVAGAIALMHHVASKKLFNMTRANPGEAALRIKQILLQSTTPIPSLKGVTVTGGRLNLAKAIEAAAEFGDTPTP